MGGLFGGPSDGDVRRAEEKAFESEQERLRLAEIRLRQTESNVLSQGSGVANAEDVVFGTDEAEGDITRLGSSAAVVTRQPGQPATINPLTEEQQAIGRITDNLGQVDFNFGSGRLL
jgi:hypothetical protein